MDCMATAPALGLTRALAANAVQGVSAGFTRELDIVGVGFRAETKGKDTIHFTLGYSHPIEFLLPDGVDLKIDDFQTISDRTPLLVDLKPAGGFVADVPGLLDRGAIPQGVTLWRL